MMLLVLVVFYLTLGCFMETLSMMITTIPIVAPVMIALGFDPIWLGIVIIILMEVALITPCRPQPICGSKLTHQRQYERRDGWQHPFCVHAAPHGCAISCLS